MGCEGVYGSEKHKLVHDLRQLIARSVILTAAPTASDQSFLLCFSRPRLRLFSKINSGCAPRSSSKCAGSPILHLPRTSHDSETGGIGQSGGAGDGIRFDSLLSVHDLRKATTRGGFPFQQHGPLLRQDIRPGDDVITVKARDLSSSSPHVNRYVV